MRTKRWMIPVGALGVAALTWLPLPAAAAPASGTATPLQAVVTLLRPFYSGAAGNALACNALRGWVLACPITPRLLYRLEHPIRFKENANLVCRCQNPPLRASWVQTDNNGFVARVKTGWGYHPSYTIIFVVARQVREGRRAASSERCGRANRSMGTVPYCRGDGRSSLRSARP